MKYMEKLYRFKTVNSLKAFAVRPDYFDNALKNNLYGPDSGRDIRKQLLFKCYKNLDEYPPYVRFPVIYRHLDGRELRDILEFRSVNPPGLISERMKQLLEEEGITGWETYPVVIYDRKGNEINGYHGFSVTGRGGCRLELPHPKEETYYYAKPEYNIWDSTQWDGTDIFRIKGYNCGFCTQKVKDVLTKNHIKSPKFDPIEEIITILNYE